MSEMSLATLGMMGDIPIDALVSSMFRRKPVSLPFATAIIAFQGD